VVERTCGTLKRVYGLHRARSIGLEKVLGEAVLKAIAYNLKGGLKHQEILLNSRLFVQKEQHSENKQQTNEK
jgi:hypothetical protein